MKHLPKFIIETIPHERQRYETVGDYYYTYYGKKDHLHFNISKTNSDYEFLVLIHELIEWYLTQKNCVTIEEIDAFDREFEENRTPGNTDEPGNDPSAPYYKEHQFATRIEKLLAKELQVDWNTYDTNLNSL